MAMETVKTGSSTITTETEARAGAEMDHVMDARGRLLTDISCLGLVQFIESALVLDCVLPSEQLWVGHCLCSIDTTDASPYVHPPVASGTTGASTATAGMGAVVSAVRVHPPSLLADLQQQQEHLQEQQRAQSHLQLAGAC